MDLPPFPRARRLRPVLCWFAAACVPLAALAAIPSDRETGLRLLQARLPAGAPVQAVTCEALARAVRLATLTHHQEAPAILSAALTAGGNRACECVVQLFRSAANAAPDHASDLLETASAICPECADALTAALSKLSVKNVVGDPKDFPVDPVVNSDPRAPSSDLSSRDYQGLGLATGDPGSPGDPGIGTGTSDVSTSRFGTGLGPGFPGAPGFSGSTASSLFALPPPVTTAVTSATNG